MRKVIASLVGLAVLLVANAAWAAFHVMQITEVFPGTMGAPNAQYVELQMWSSGQNQVAGHAVTIHDAAGAVVGTYTFSAAVPNGANQATILIATTEAATLFTITPDLVMTPMINMAGGKVCFDNIDCVAWGNYTGGQTPAAVGQPAYQQRGLIRGRSLARNLGSNAMLDGGDDTHVSAADFADAIPSPKTNPGTNGTIPGNVCGNNSIEGLESCDNGNQTSNDGCSSLCVTESCGDGITQTSEQCDDTNTISTDACSNTCMTQTPQVDGPPDGPPVMPDARGNMDTGDGGGGGCCETGGAGSGGAGVLAMLVLGFLLRPRRRS